MQHHVLALSLVAVVLNGRLPTSSASMDKPNIIVIVADDMGFNDVGFHGGDVRTPNIDALAGHGIILNRHYALPSCTPSRAALMTAKYPIRTGMHGGPLPAGVLRGLPLKEKIFPQYFKELGYNTHLIGKWHLGFETRSHMPTHRGLDSFFGYLNGYLSYYDGVHTHAGMPGRDFRRNEDSIWEEVYGQYLTGVLTQEAVRVIENHNSGGGLLLFLNHAAPHTGNLNHEREAPPNSSNFTKKAILKEMVRWLDDSVGEVVLSLNNNGLLNNSIIVFLSDNGAPTVDYLYGYDNQGSNWPFRGTKMSIHEGGVRTTALVWSPLLRQPRVSTGLFHITDWLPTLFSAAGGPSSGMQNLDGISQWKSLVSGTPSPRNEVLIGIDPEWDNEAFIQGNWKIVKNNEPGSPAAFVDDFYGESGRDAPYDSADVEYSITGTILKKPPKPYDQVRQQASINDRCIDTEWAVATDCHSKYCLYDILTDVSECNDLSTQYPSVVSELSSRLESFREIMMPLKNKTFDLRADPAYRGDVWGPWIENGAAPVLANALILSITIPLILLRSLLG